MGRQRRVSRTVDPAARAGDPVRQRAVCVSGPDVPPRERRRDPFFPAIPTRIFEQHMTYIARAYRVLTVETRGSDRAWRRSAVGRSPSRSTTATGTPDPRRPDPRAPGRAGDDLPGDGIHRDGRDPLGGSGGAGAEADEGFSSVVSPWGEAFSLAGSVRAPAGARPDAAAPEAAAGQCLSRGRGGPVERLDVPDEPSRPVSMLSWDDVRRSPGSASRSGPIRCRTRSSRRSRHWASMGRDRRPRDAIAAACGRAPRAFAYPNGGTEDYTPAVVGLVRRAGFRVRSRRASG